VVTHSVNVAIFAMKLGEGLNYAPSRLASLGTAALVHDVGMVSLPDEIYTKEVLDPSEQKALRNHPVKGAEYLSNLDEQDAWLAEVALHEHEREDGSGYPSGLKGHQIREEAKIIGLVDTYAGLVQSRPDRRGLTPFDAVKEITQTHRKRFHPRILRALLQKLSAFPIGSLVRLNSGIVGRVSQTFEAYPLRPVVVPLFDADKWPMENATPVSLRENPILHISGVVYPEDRRQRSS
jgi:HD-GYP domain-containing protein (c-di-GMP phosphodiesterase class II)